MALLSIEQGFAGQVATYPSATLRVDTSDTEAQVTTAGYLDSTKHAGIQFNNKMVALVTTSDTYTKWYQVRVSSTGVVSLILL